MSLNTDPSLSNMNDCGCCEGLSVRTPVEIINRDGLTAIAYRAGTHEKFKMSMLARLSSSEFPALRKLTTRNDDDFTIALLDAWAMVADVLTFYQERIANETYLRTATERFSITQLAWLIGYELSPGVAASTYLAFTMAEAEGSPLRTTIDTGTKVQSIPGPGEQAQIFETVEKIEARVEWNEIKPEKTEFKLPSSGTEVIYLKGTSTNLKIGDALLFVGEERENDPRSKNWDFRRVKKITSDDKNGFTAVRLDKGLGSELPHVAPEKNPKVYALRQRAALFGYNAPEWRAMPDNVKRTYLGLPSSVEVPVCCDQWPGFSIRGSGKGLDAEYFDNKNLTGNPKLKRIDPLVNFIWGTGSPFTPFVEVFSARWKGFIQPKCTGEYTFYTISDDGVRLWVNNIKIIDNWTDHGSTQDTAKEKLNLKTDELYPVRLEYYEQGGLAEMRLLWDGPDMPQEVVPSSQLHVSADLPPVIYLDAIYPQILSGSWLMLSIPGYQELYQVESVAEDSRSNFTLTAKTTRMTLKGENLKLFDNHLRDTVVFAQSEQLEFAEQPLRTPVLGSPSEKLRLADETLTPVEGSKITFVKSVSGLEKGHMLIVSGKRLSARITKEMMLESADGFQSLQLRPGDVLTIIESPRVTSGSVKWHLMNLDGFDGFVTTTSNEIILEPADNDDELVSEAVEVEESFGDPTTVKLKRALKNSYDRTTVSIYANIVLATHGETVKEILGSGKAEQPYQRFSLRQPPLTYVSSPKPGGAEPTLEIRVNELLWHEVPALYGHGPDEHIYITRTEDDGKTTVQFGDGYTGARLPTGQENVRSTYRKGIGLSGLVKANQLKLLMTRPLGVKDVNNPLDSNGGADREYLEDARHNAPLKVLTLDRIVSLLDYEDFARAYAGIAKALATWTWDGEKQGVFITVAGPGGAKILPDSELYKNLLTSIKNAGDPSVPLRVQSYIPALFRLDASIKIDPAHSSEKVMDALNKSLQTKFSFEARSFGQSVMLSEVMAVMAAVSGVIFVNVDKLNRIDGKGGDGLKQPLTAAVPKAGADADILAAELLTLDSSTLDIKVM